MLRKLVTAIVSVSALVPSVVFGLGMGEVELESFLNQPLDARIELLQTRGLTQAEVIANLANSSEFAAAGVDRSFFLSQLKFAVETGEDGKTYLKISSKRPVTEPYLNFLVEVQWPAGRLLREYTLLLDPPEFKDDLPLAIRAPERSESPGAGSNVGVALSDDVPGVEISTDRASPVEPEVTPAPRAAIVEQSGQAPQVSQSATGETSGMSKPGPESMVSAPKTPVAGSTLPAASDVSYKVKRGDNLSSIVKKTQANPEVPMAQALVAYQYLNPDAFIDDNMNLVKTGTVLRVPSEEQIRQVTRSEAIQEIATQNKAWRAKLQARSVAQEDQQLAGRQLDGTGRELTPDEAPSTSEDGRLSLVTPGAESSVDDGASGRGEGANAEGMSALEDQLAMQTEEVEKFSVANEGLVTELQDVTSLVKKTDKVLVLKDDQIAALQAQLKMLREQDEMADAGAVGEMPAVEDIQDPVAVQEIDADTDESEVSDTTPENSTPDSSTSDAMDETAENLAEMEEPVVDDAGMQEFDEAIAEPVEKPSLFSNPLYLGAAGGLVLAVLAFLWVRSRREDEDEDDYEDYDFDEEAEKNVEAEGDDDDLGEQDFSTENLDKQLLEAEDDFDIDTLLSEADIYVAYGHFPKAMAMLVDGLKEAPNSLGLNLKVLEVCAESKDTARFEQVEAHVRSFASDDETLAKINGFRSDLGLAAGNGPDGASEEFSEEETQFLGEETSVPVVDEGEDFLSLADIEAELDVGGQGLGGSDEVASAENFDEELTTDSRFTAEETQVNTDDELDLSGGEFDFNFEETSVPEDEEFDLDADLEAFSPDDALADIDEEIGNMDDDLAALRESELDVPELSESGLDDLELEVTDESSFDSADNAVESAALDIDDDFSLDEGAVEVESNPVLTMNDEDASLMDGVDEVGTKLDLATAYIEMGDHEGAKDILDEVLLEGNDDQQKLAKDLLDRVG